MCIRMNACISMNTYTYIPTREFSDHLHSKPLSSAWVQNHARILTCICANIPSDNLHSNKYAHAHIY